MQAITKKPYKQTQDSHKHSEQVFTESYQYFISLIQAIETAQHTIDMEIYYFSKDILAQQVKSALISSAKRGVKVRLLVDGAGTPFWSGRFVKALERAGVECKIFHPFPWGFRQSTRSVVKLPFTLKIIYLMLKINSRNHRKVCIIDKKTAYIGSFNITKDHLSKKIGGNGWRDTGVCLSGLDLTELYGAFEAAWDHYPLQERLQKLFRQVNINAIIRLNNTRQRRRILYHNLLSRIDKAQQRIWIANAYFIPNPSLTKKLCKAAQNGVDVRILLPYHSDVPIIPIMSNVFYQTLLQAGVKIFEYLPSMLHAKTIILDSWVMIGTSNLNHRSLLHDLEVDVNLQQRASIKEIENQFQEDLKQSCEISLENWRKRHWSLHMLGKILLYIRYFS